MLGIAKTLLMVGLIANNVNASYESDCMIRYEKQGYTFKERGLYVTEYEGRIGYREIYEDEYGWEGETGICFSCRLAGLCQNVELNKPYFSAYNDMTDFLEIIYMYDYEG